MANYIINPNEVVGMLIPTVYISRITLEKAGFIQSNFQDNPHIDPSPGGKIMSVRTVNEGVIDRAFATGIEGEKTYGNDPLNVTIQLTVKDVTSNNLSKWFVQNPDNTPHGGAHQLGAGKTIKDYIEVVVIRTTTPAATQHWSQANLYSSDDPSTKSFSNSDRFKFTLKDLEGDPNVLDRHYQEYDSAGNSVRNICKNITSNAAWKSTSGGNALPLEPNPQHLAYFVWAQFDIEAFLEDYNVGDNTIPSNFMDSNNMIGKINSDVVFKTGELVKTSYIFLEALAPSSGGSYTAETVTATNKIWAGPVNYVENMDLGELSPNASPAYYTGWSGGKSFISLSETPLLVQRTIPNTKIQDFRVARRIDKLNLSLSNLENVVLKLVNKNSRSVIKDTKFSYFTDIHLSRDKNNNCRFFFGIDLRKMVRENSVYSGLFTANSGWLDQAMTKVRIASMRIFRERVQGSSELGDSPYFFPKNNHFEPVHKLKKFNNGLRRGDRTTSEAETVRTMTLIREEFEKPNKKYRSEKARARPADAPGRAAGGMTRVGAARVENTGPRFRAVWNTTNNPGTYVSYDPSDELIIEAVETPVEAGGYILESTPYVTDGTSTIKQFGTIIPMFGGIYYYTGIDGGMADITDGYYRYRIELEILDNSVLFLLSQQTNLSALIDDLEKYFTIGSQPGINGIKETKRGDPHTLEEDVLVGRTRQVANFDPITNRFSQNFINGQGQQWQGYNFASRYVSILKVFVNLDNVEQGKIQSALDIYTNPQSGNLQGCLLLLELFRKLMSVIERAIGVQKGTPKAASNGSTEQDEESNVSAPRLNSFKMKHTFSSYYDGNLPQNTGYDFLGTGIGESPTMPVIPANTGLRMITANDFKMKIVPREIKKIFKSSESVINLHGLAAHLRGTGQIGTSLQNTDYSYLTPAIIVTPNQNVQMVSEDPSQPPPNINSRDFMNMTISDVVLQDNPTTDRAQGNSLKEKVADFFAYNHDLTSVSEPEVSSPIIRPGEDNSNTKTEAEALAEYLQSAEQQATANNLAFNVLWNLISTGVSSEGNRGGASLPEGTNQKNIDFYNPNNNFDGFLRPPVNLSADDITNLPNSIKALIRYNVQTDSATGGTIYESALKDDIENFLKSQPFSSPEFRSKAKILFETIGEIQYLNGYGSTTYAQPNGAEISEPSITMPIWEKLDHEAYGAASAGYLLCRIRRWENGTFKIQKDSAFPIYEEYFILQGGTAPAVTNFRWEQPLSRTSAPEPVTPAMVYGEADVRGERGGGVGEGVSADYTTSNPAPSSATGFSAQDAAQRAANANPSAAGQGSSMVGSGISGASSGAGTGGAAATATGGATYTAGSNNPAGGMSQ